MKQRLVSLATNAALLCLGAAFLQFTRDGVQEFRHYIHGYSVDVLCQIAIYIAAFLLIRFGRTSRWTLLIILVFALAVRLVGIVTPEFLSTDLYRYVWDGKVQGAGINPYRFIPADPHLALLRDQAIYPKINRKDYAHTIYPPGAQILFWLITRISATEPGMKAAMVAFEALGCWAMMRILVLLHRPREWIVLYAWHPLCVWEIGSSGHVDGIVIGLLSLAALAIFEERFRRAALCFTAAALVKLYPGILLFSLGRKLSARILALCASLVAACYAIYAGAGLGVFGFLGGYAHEEGLETGRRYFLLAFADRHLRFYVPASVFLGVAAAALAGIAIWAFGRERNPQQMIAVALALTLVGTLIFSPHYPWYFLWTLPFSVILGYVPGLVLTLGAVYWFATDLAIPGEKMFRMNEYLYGMFFLAVLADGLVRFVRRKQQANAKIRNEEVILAMRTQC